MIFLLFFLTDFNSVILCIFHIFLIHEKNSKTLWKYVFITRFLSVIKIPTDSTMSTTSEQTDTTSRQASTTSGHTSGKRSTTSGQTSTTSG